MSESLCGVYFDISNANYF